MTGLFKKAGGRLSLRWRFGRGPVTIDPDPDNHIFNSIRIGGKLGQDPGQFFFTGINVIGPFDAHFNTGDFLVWPGKEKPRSAPSHKRPVEAASPAAGLKKKGDFYRKGIATDGPDGLSLFPDIQPPARSLPRPRRRPGIWPGYWWNRCAENEKFFARNGGY